MKPELDKLAREILNRHCEYMDGLDRGQCSMKTSNALAAVREALSISVGGGVVVGGQDQEVMGDGLRPQPATHEPSPSGLGPTGGCQAQEGGEA